MSIIAERRCYYKAKTYKYAHDSWQTLVIAIYTVCSTIAIQIEAGKIGCSSDTGDQHAMAATGVEGNSGIPEDLSVHSSQKIVCTPGSSRI